MSELCVCVWWAHDAQPPSTDVRNETSCAISNQYWTLRVSPHADLHHVKNIDSVFSGAPCRIHWEPRPQVARCWRNIDNPNVSLWTKITWSRTVRTFPLPQPLQSPSCLLLLLLLLLFPPHLLRACSDPHLLRAQTGSLKRTFSFPPSFFFFFFFFLTTRFSFTHPGVHSSGFYRTTPTFVSFRFFFLPRRSSGYAVGAGEDRGGTYHRWTEALFTTLRYTRLNTWSINSLLPRHTGRETEMDTLWGN